MASNLLPFALLVALVLQAFFHSGSCDYCSDSLAVTSCPDVSTYSQIDLSAYAGKWYEIGSSASFKNLMEAGGVCAEAQYTAENSTTLKVENSNFLTASPLAITAVGGISGSSSLVCQQARAVCSELNTGDSLLNEGLSKVWKFQSDISSSYPTEAGQVSTAANKIQQAMPNFAPQLAQLSQYVTQLQTQNSQLSQTDGDASGVVSSIKSTCSDASSLVTNINSMYQTISDAQLDLINVAKSLFQQGGDAVSQSFTLTDAATEVLGGAAIIQTQVGGMSAAFTASSKAADSVLSDKDKPYYNVSSVSGYATVNGSDASKLNVAITPLPGKAFPAPYWILAVDGSSSSGYDAALVYSCAEVPTGGIGQTLWILSRNPTLSSDVIDKFLTLADSLGIKHDCASAFVYTVRSSKCPS
jgi:lipocalin